MDSETEHVILGSLRREAERRTTIIVSHRASAVKELDQIVCLQRGEVVQSGTHAELVARDGYYRMMVELQEMEK